MSALAGCGEAFTSGSESTGGSAGTTNTGVGGALGAGGQTNVASGGNGNGAGGKLINSGGSPAAGTGGDSEHSGGACSTGESPASAACTVIEALGVFVSPRGSDSKGKGSREAPFATLAKAISEARKQSKRVYACSTAGAFSESLLLDASFDQTELYGGFDCVDWTYSADKPTQVQSPTARALIAVELSSLVVEDFTFSAADATEPGDSSAAAWIVNSKGVVLRRVSLTAGNGADGASGIGTHEPAPRGADGNPGVAACQVSKAPNEGGASVTTSCDEPTESVGGNGGDGGTDNKSGGNGSPGEPIAMGSRGQAGYGQTLATTWNCGVGPSLGGGQVGSDGVGQPAAPGGMTSASNQGTLTADRFIGVAGQDGANGAPGQGGGGGGGAIAPLSCGSTLPRTGASGGGGGGGGCGGKGGRGGGAGGGSFALVSFHSNITLEGGVLTAQHGGNGGKGGFGQPGGAGGLGGLPGDGSSGSQPGCAGAAGGKGGDGGHGGGGAGGPSAAIVFSGWQPTKIGTLLKSSRTLSSGGEDGAGSGKGSGMGSPGTSSEVLGLSG
ncbi:MAG: hypothetical protein ACOY0T_32565 [Myxococcota bacterium]